jgi:hypothetical protein
VSKKKQDTPLSDAARAALGAAEFLGNTFHLTQDNLACYPEIKALVLALGGRWNRHRERHEFAEGVDAEALIRAACARGAIPPTNPLDYYPTPAAVVDGMLGNEWLRSRLEARRVCAEMDGRPLRMLEPNAGTGAIARKLAAIPGELTCLEINPVATAVLRATLPAAKVIEGDFLGFTPPYRFDLVVMNPPFAGQQWRKHLMHAYGMLDRLGVLACVAPAGFLRGGAEDLEFMRFVNAHGELEALPAGTFPGVAVDTCVIVLENDPSPHWLEQEHEGFSTGHAWEIYTSVSSDGELLRAVGQCRGFAAFEAVLRGFERQANFEYRIPVRVDAEIAAEVLEQIAELTPEYVRDELRQAMPERPAVQGQLRLVA